MLNVSENWRLRHYQGMYSQWRSTPKGTTVQNLAIPAAMVFHRCTRARGHAHARQRGTNNVYDAVRCAPTSP
eukprot:45994-Alexandrium_andersonii.AAC.1